MQLRGYAREAFLPKCTPDFKSAHGAAQLEQSSARSCRISLWFAKAGKPSFP